jgi:hypothetical protein
MVSQRGGSQNNGRPTLVNPDTSVYHRSIGSFWTISVKYVGQFSILVQSVFQCAISWWNALDRFAVFLFAFVKAIYM